MIRAIMLAAAAAALLVGCTPAEPQPTNAAADPASPPSAVVEEARARGVDFWAIGQEPGWHVEISDGERIDVEVDYGQTKISMAAPRPQQAGPGRMHYSAGTKEHRLTIDIREGECRDTMSGAAYPALVTLTLDGKQYQGCGQRLD